MMISQEIVELIKARGLFDDFRHEVYNDIESKPYSNALKQQIEESVTKYLADVRWNSTLNKNDIRNKLRTDVLQIENFNESFQLLLNHTIDLDMQSDFSLKIIKFFERYCLNEKMMSECDFYFSEGLKTPNVSLLVPKKEFNEEIPPLPPSPPKEVVPPPPLPPLPISEFENVDIKPDLASLKYNVDTTFQLKMETEDTNDRPPNALEALDMIKNKLAQLLNTGNLDLNSLDLNLTNLQSVQMTENELEVNSSPNLNDIVVTTSTDNNVYKIDDDLKSSQSCDTTSQLMESLSQSKPKSPQSSTKKFTEIGEGSLAEEILKTVDKNNKSFFTTDEYSKINISPFKPDIISGQIISSKLQIDKEDISVSSVHTSDLSSLEDQISISSSDLPEMDDDMLVPEETTTQINVKKATNNTKSNESQPIMQHIYNYLLGGYLCPENKDCFDYYQNIVNLNQLQQAKQNAEVAANMSADSEDELMKDLTDHSFANYNALESASSAFKGCPRVFKQQQQQSNLKSKRSPNNDNVQTTPKPEMDALEFSMMGEKLKYFDEGEEGGNDDVAKRTKFSPKSPPSDNTSYHGLYSSEERFPRYFKEKKDCSFLPVPSLPHLPSSRKTKAEIIAEAYKPKGGANYICKGTSSNTSIKTESMLAATTDSPNAADIPFDNYYEKRANIKPATPSSKRKYRKKVEGLTAITTTPSDMIILPTQKVREHLKKKVFSKHPHGTKHSNISNQQTAVTTSATKNYEQNRESSAPFINTIGEKYEMVPERATSLEKSGGKHHLPLYNRSNDKTWATTADTTNTSLGYTKNYYTPHLHHDRISSNKCSASDTNSPQINTRDPVTNSFSTTNKEPVEQFTYLRNQRHQKFYSKQQSSLYRSGYETKNQGNLLPPPPSPNYYYNEEGRISPYRYKTSGGVGVGSSLDPRTTITRGTREFNDESQEFLRDDHVSYGGGGSARSNKSRSRSKSIISADSQPPLPSSEPPPQQRFTKPNKRRFHHPHPPPFHHQRPQNRPFFDHHQMNHRQVVNERIQHHHQQQLYGEDRRAPPHPPPLPLLSDVGALQRAHQGGGGGSQTSTGGEASSYQEEYAGGGGDHSGNSHEYYYHKKFHSSLTHHQLQQQNPYHHHQQH